MQNNKKFNRTFKVSLVAIALGLVNQAWAESIQCNNDSISISEKNNEVLTRSC